MTEPLETDLDARAGRMFQAALRRSHLAAAHDLPALLAEEARTVGIDELVVHLLDLEQKVLVPVPGSGAPAGAPLPVTGTMAGRAFIHTTTVQAEADGGRRLWLPLVDGTERLGVVAATFRDRREPVSGPLLALCERYMHLIASLIVNKMQYSDVFALLQRVRPMSTAGELLRGLVPPQVLSSDDFVLAALLEPAYDMGGDAYDYALNPGVLHLAVFDALGHGLSAAGMASFALSVYRHRRRHGERLTDTCAAIDEAVAAEFPDTRFVTGVLAQIDLDAGRLRWVNAGHPPPLLLRGGRFVKALEVARLPPMGLRLQTEPPAVGDLSLEPGDMILLYTDGLTESRRPDGRLFTTGRLAEFIERQAAGGQAAPETLRGLRHAIVEHGHGRLRDDATALLVEWRRGTQSTVTPDTV